MKLALIGYGKMGKMVEALALRRGHSVTARVTSSNWKEEEKGIAEADLCIEFSTPHAVMGNIERLAELKKELVIGTTGWSPHLERVRALVDQHNIGVLYSPNFSLGVQVMLQLLSRAAALMEAFPEYDVAAFESHHANKKDCPSGTALAIAETIEKEMSRIDTLPISSMRCGSMIGTHTVFFDSPEETLSLSHEAKSREGFGKGALIAAEWLRGKKGLYTFADCIGEKW